MIGAMKINGYEIKPDASLFTLKKPVEM